MKSFGDIIYEKISSARGRLFVQGEVAELTYSAFTNFSQHINGMNDEPIKISYPIGYRADNTVMNSTTTFSKQDLIGRFDFLGQYQLPVNGLYQLVTIIESLLGDLVREILVKYPAKIQNKKQVDYELILKANSLEEVKLSLVNTFLNELAYKSPKEYAEEFAKITGIKLLEEPIFHKYIELKATRDIYIHNNGTANDIYRAKAATLARVKSGEYLPVTLQYFLQSYECCLQLTEILELKSHEIWPSADFESSRLTNKSEQKEKVIENAIENVPGNEQLIGKAHTKKVSKISNAHKKIKKEEIIENATVNESNNEKSDDKEIAAKGSKVSSSRKK